MYGTQLPWRELFEMPAFSHATDFYKETLEPWLAEHEEQRLWPSQFDALTRNDWYTATDEDLCVLYAISRVTSKLLLRFQTGRADGSDYPGPNISLQDFQTFHEQLGFRIVDVFEFHPFYHEIASVKQSPDDDAPIQLIDFRWPCLMLGDMMYCRAAVEVEGGINHVVKSIAESSQLHWTHRRKDRPYSDQSHGWGSNSQWATRFRRDYRTSTGYHFNVDGDLSLPETDDLDGVSKATMIELVRHRCLIKSQCEDPEVYPYPYRYLERF